jgi:hypothetical protein
MKKDIPILEYTLLIAIVMGALVFFIHMKNENTDFCRKVFNGLVKGSYAVQKFIDWEKLKAMNVDVGATYIKFTTEKQRSDYKQAFIKYLSLGFKQTGSKLDLFTNWRAYDRYTDKTVVAADYRGKIILFTISRDGKRKLIAIQWKEADATNAKDR